MATTPERLGGRILWGLCVGLLLGVASKLAAAAIPALETPLQWLAFNVLDPFGQIFLRLLFFVVVPLVFGSLALGLLHLNRLGQLGPLAAKTFSLFIANMVVGVVLGLLFMNLVEPGRLVDAEMRQRMLAEYGGQAAEMNRAMAAQGGITFGSLVEMIMPRNVLRAVVDFQILPLILFAILVGAAGLQLDEARRFRLRDSLETVVDLMTRIVHMAMLLAPFAVPAMIFSAVVKFGFDFLQSLLLFMVGVLGVIALHLFGTMGLVVRLFGGRSPRDFFRAVRPVLVTGFSTSSSSATLPTTIQVSREVLGVSPAVSGFVLPLGATMNMSGTALYEGCVVLFVAQVYGVPLGLAQQVTLVLLAVMSAVAVAGIPGGSLPLLVGLLVNFGVPAEGIALVLGVDRLLDMARTALNVGADLAVACVVDAGTSDARM